MMSMSGGWFFVVASEAISVSNQNIKLPGIGSYIALAIEQRDLGAIGWAIVAMLVGILIYDQLFFRPLRRLGRQVPLRGAAGRRGAGLVAADLMQRARLPRAVAGLFAALWAWLGRSPALGRERRSQRPPRPWPALPSWSRALWNTALALGALVCRGPRSSLRPRRGRLGRGRLGAARAGLLHDAAGDRADRAGVADLGADRRLDRHESALAQRVQAVAQFLAAFPANLMFPVVVVLIVHFDLNVDIWTSPLMVLGTQWYILFNVIAGASTLPDRAALRGQQSRLERLAALAALLLPAIFPAYVTGAITASGGSWNARIVAEVRDLGRHDAGGARGWAATSPA